jgi:hypothetical protein
MDDIEKRLRCIKASLPDHRFCKVYSRKMPIIKESCKDCSFSIKIRKEWLKNKGV